MWFRILVISANNTKNKLKNSDTLTNSKFQDNVLKNDNAQIRKEIKKINRKLNQLDRSVNTDAVNKK